MTDILRAKDGFSEAFITVGDRYEVHLTPIGRDEPATQTQEESLRTRRGHGSVPTVEDESPSKDIV